MAIIPEFFMNAVVALGTLNIKGEKLWVGSGFLFGKKELDNPENATVYIITNKHVVNGYDHLFARFNNQGAIGTCDITIPLCDNGVCHYSEHPNPNVDIVAIQLIPQAIIDSHLSLDFFIEGEHTLTLEQMKNSGVNEGSLVYTLGFPMNLVGESTKAPICRLGCVSRIADAFLNPDSSAHFLVDTQVFPGNSGGPVINRPEVISISGTSYNSSANLIGIVSAFIPYSVQTGRDVMIREENSGLAIVHPIDRIKEVVEIEWKKRRL